MDEISLRLGEGGTGDWRRRRGRRRRIIHSESETLVPAKQGRWRDGAPAVQLPLRRPAQDQRLNRDHTADNFRRNQVRVPYEKDFQFSIRQ